MVRYLFELTNYENQGYQIRHYKFGNYTYPKRKLLISNTQFEKPKQ